MVCCMLSVSILLIIVFSAFVGWWDFMLWYIWLNHFWVIDQLYLIFFPVSLRGLRCFEWFFLDNFMLWHVWRDHFGVFDQYYFGILSGCLLRTDGYCDLFWDTFWLLVENWWILWFTLGYFSVACWEPMDIVIYHLMLFNCSWRTNVNIVDYLLMFFSRLYRVEVILLWFLICDFMNLG